VNQTADVVATAAFYLTVVPWSYGFWGLLMMSSAAFNALGKPLPSTMLSFTRTFLLYIPLAFLLNLWLDYRGIFIAVGISNFIMGGLAFLWFRRAFFPRA
jgi:Na+-driven multidrug efflux pump